MTQLAEDIVGSVGRGGNLVSQLKELLVIEGIMAGVAFFQVFGGYLSMFP